MDQRKFCCSIRLDLLRIPVTIPCGHSYCKNCIRSHWNEEDQREVHSCPQCRQTFRPRPALVKNTILADLVEELKKAELQAAPTDHFYAGPEDVACDFCIGTKQKALKSCLQCLVSYCEKHLQPHYESPAFEKHKLINPSKKLQENTCSHHDKVMKVFCCTDQQCICYLCSMEEHKGHRAVPASAERIQRQRELETSQQRIQERIQDRHKEVKVLQQEVEAIDRSADEAVRNSEKVFNQLVNLIKNFSFEVKQQIRAKQKSEVTPVRELQEKLQQEITDLKRKDAELEQFLQIEDHIQFLHNYPSLPCLTESPSINTRRLQYFEDMTAAVSEIQEKLQDVLSDVLTKISLTETDGAVLLPQAEPKTRAEFLQYSCQITLDPNTAHKQLLLSEGNKKATVTSEKQRYSNQQDRFTDMFQVLSRESLSGHHYWEVERKRYEISIAVTYKDISRTGYESGFGNDDKSWALECFSDHYEFRHKSVSTFISGSQSSRIGVYLDHSAGILSFYSVSENMTLLHREQTTLTQPLYHGLGVFSLLGSESAAEICKFE